ncbi:pectate lyase [Brevundimonas intermedia]|uniref:Pectate lyase n=1 Tax=Brevundimonas intermedia TaxID=74315 RepID=A0ABQ5TBN5_9CAUL|nr:pectate lyase [Brevundimonas intermedia]GLK50242.1 pectate lyase [Brevundimonas intermedia]
MSRRSLILTSVIALVLASSPLAPAFAAAETDTPAWGSQVVRRPADWYRSDAARNMAATVVLHQSSEGGWPKNTDLFAPPRPNADPGLANTIDNDGTTLPLDFLARVISAGDEAARPAFDRGLDYLLEAQRPNGGWPQFYPLRGGYYDQITYNDDAMVRVLRLLQGVAGGRSPYGFVDPARRARAADAVEAGTALILKTQVLRNGRLTAWCAQHDAVTLEPAWARRFEPPSLSGNESVGVVRFLMSIDHPSPDVIAAVEGAVDWFRAVALPDLRVETFETDGKPDRRVVAAPGEGPLWARFYDLETDAPIFMGRESIARASLAEIEQERRAGYNYVGTWPAALINVDYPAWRTRVGLPAR